jgi:hypothetical protein
LFFKNAQLLFKWPEGHGQTFSLHSQRFSASFNLSDRQYLYPAAGDPAARSAYLVILFSAKILKRSHFWIKVFVFHAKKQPKRSPQMEELKIIKLFCLVDDFTKRFNETCAQKKIEYKKKKIRKRESRMSLSEIMTVLLLFQQSNYRTFKHFYLKEVRANLKFLFPKLVRPDKPRLFFPIKELEQIRLVDTAC